MTRPEGPAPGDDSIRLDKWLFFARFLKTRALAATLIGNGRVRVNGQPVSRPGRTVRPGDVLTFAQGGRVRVVRILSPGTRRGPAAEAQALYFDLDGPAGPDTMSQSDADSSSRVDRSGQPD